MIFEASFRISLLLLYIILYSTIPTFRKRSAPKTHYSANEFSLLFPGLANWIRLFVEGKRDTKNEHLPFLSSWFRRRNLVLFVVFMFDRKMQWCLFITKSVYCSLFRHFFCCFFSTEKSLQHKNIRDLLFKIAFFGRKFSLLLLFLFLFSEINVHDSKCYE